MLTRRFFLTASAASIVSVGFPFTAAAVQSTKDPVISAIDHGLEEKFEVYESDQLVALLNLVGVEQPHIAETKVAQYIFNFESTERVILSEATYQVAHPTLGELELFLQPCGIVNIDQHDGIQYRACIAMLK